MDDMKGDIENAKNFLKNIRTYKCIYQVCSIRYKNQLFYILSTDKWKLKYKIPFIIASKV